MSKALQEFYRMRDTLVSEGYNIPANYGSYIAVENELKALEIIRKYITMNRAFKDQTKGQSDMTLIEIKALIPDSEYNLLKEVLE